MRMAPMDWVWSSKTGSKLKPAFSDFQTPPLAAPTQMVTGSVALPSMAEIRPLMTAGPMARALSPPKVAESIFDLRGVGDQAHDQPEPPRSIQTVRSQRNAFHVVPLCTRLLPQYAQGDFAHRSLLERIVVSRETSETDGIDVLRMVLPMAQHERLMTCDSRCRSVTLW